MANTYCNWASCGEWCLTKTSGFCPQIHATSRRNGTDIHLENCTRIQTTSCPQVTYIYNNYSNSIFKNFQLFFVFLFQVQADALKSKYNCNNGTECASLTGVFNCSLGILSISLT